MGCVRLAASKPVGLLILPIFVPILFVIVLLGRFSRRDGNGDGLHIRRRVWTRFRAGAVLFQRSPGATDAAADATPGAPHEGCDEGGRDDEWTAKHFAGGA